MADDTQATTAPSTFPSSTSLPEVGSTRSSLTVRVVPDIDPLDREDAPDTPPPSYPTHLPHHLRHRSDDKEGKPLLTPPLSSSSPSFKLLPGPPADTTPGRYVTSTSSRRRRLLLALVALFLGGLALVKLLSSSASKPGHLLPDVMDHFAVVNPPTEPPSTYPPPSRLGHHAATGHRQGKAKSHGNKHNAAASSLASLSAASHHTSALTSETNDTPSPPAYTLTANEELGALIAYLTSLGAHAQVPAHFSLDKYRKHPEVILGFKLYEDHPPANGESEAERAWRSERVRREVEEIVSETWVLHPVVIFGHTREPVTRETMAYFKSLGLSPAPTFFGVDRRADYASLTPLLLELTGASKLPLVIIGGKPLLAPSKIESQGLVLSIPPPAELTTMLGRAGVKLKGDARKKRPGSGQQKEKN